jgi:hypothetical protein
MLVAHHIFSRSGQRLMPTAEACIARNRARMRIALLRYRESLLL